MKSSNFQGKHHSEETKRKISLAKKGVPTWNKGKSYKAGEPKIWKRVHDEKNPSWKGDNVGYRGLHKWVEKHLGKPNECSHCGRKSSGHNMHWANVSGEYHRDLNDWIRLCAKCHGEHDTKLRKINLKTI